MNKLGQNFNRQSIRLKGFDYHSAGLYFITIVIQNREQLFGTIHNNEMVLNDAGKMIVRWYSELQNKYTDKVCHDMIVMPDHFHCILENTTGNADTASIPDAVCWFKTMTTNAYIRGVKQNGWPVFKRKLWQRNYYEHVIRTSESYQRISNYIQKNPANYKR